MRVVSLVEARSGIMSSSCATTVSVVVSGCLSEPKAATTKKMAKTVVRIMRFLLLSDSAEFPFTAKLFYCVAVGIFRISQPILVVINPQGDGFEVLRGKDRDILPGPLPDDALGLLFVEPEQLPVGRGLNLRQC